MILLLRTLSRSLAFVLLAVVALACLVAAGFSVMSGPSGLPKLGELVHTREAAQHVDFFLFRLEQGRMPEAQQAGIGAGIAAVVGLVLLAGALLPRREKTLEMEKGSEGRIAARRRPLQQAARSLAGKPRGVTRARSRVRGRWRRAGGRLRLKVGRGAGAEAKPLAAEVKSEVASLADPFSLKTRVRTRRDEKRGAVR